MMSGNDEKPKKAIKGCEFCRHWLRRGHSIWASCIKLGYSTNRAWGLKCPYYEEWNSDVRK
jgi:hypothetical protein